MLSFIYGTFNLPCEHSLQDLKQNVHFGTLRALPNCSWSRKSTKFPIFAGLGRMTGTCWQRQLIKFRKLWKSLWKIIPLHSTLDRSRRLQEGVKDTLYCSLGRVTFEKDMRILHSFFERRTVPTVDQPTILILLHWASEALAFPFKWSRPSG